MTRCLPPGGTLEQRLQRDPSCERYGLMDAVEAWSDCNRATGHVYRVDDAEPRYRRPGDTVEIYVRRADLPWFEKRFDADA